jgi:phosphomevalonate kinase
MIEQEPIIVQNDKQIKPLGILITGKRYSGKDTFAEYLNQKLLDLNISSVIRSTAYNLKRLFCQNLGLDLEKFIYDRDYKEKYRQELSKFVMGLSQRTNIDNFTESLQKDLKTHDVIIISDLRSLFDQDELKELFPCVITIKISASDATREARGLTFNAYDDSGFESEIDLISFDREIQNNGSLDDLSLQANNLAREIKSCCQFNIL